MNFRILTFVLIVVVFACNKPAVQLETVSDTSTLTLPTEAAVANAPLANQSEPTFSDTNPEARFFPKDSTYTVIATSGTLLRQQPGWAAAVSLQLPYGTHLTVIERMQYDTLQEPISKHKVAGTWVKMRYKNNEGFVFSADVMSRDYNEHRHPVHFFVKGGHCLSNYEFSPDYNYYAVYQQDSLHHYMRRVQPVFYVRHEIPTGLDVWEWFHIETDLGGEPLFIFGLPKKLNEQGIVSYPPTRYEYYSETDTPEPVQTSHYTIHIVRENKDSGWPIPEVALLDRKGVRIQKFVGSKILFCGDLDQDGIADLMYLDTNEKEGGYHLALSSYARAGKFLEAVGYYQLGYCC
jgi:hypothetical protein